MNAVPTLSLYKIDLELLQLLHAREDLQADTEMTPQEIAASVEALDAQIANYLPQALANRADEVANIIRQLEAMEEADAREMARIRDRRQQRIQARQYLEQRVLELMTRADQKRIEGQHVTLFRKKNPASVDVAQPDLVPDPYKRLTVTFSADLWQRLQTRVMMTETKGSELFGEMMDAKQGAPEVMLQKVKDELKAGVGVPGCRLIEDKHRLEIK
jgi:ParB-like chromosome segregation protein Spo0J